MMAQAATEVAYALCSVSSHQESHLRSWANIECHKVWPGGLVRPGRPATARAPPLEVSPPKAAALLRTRPSRLVATLYISNYCLFGSKERDWRRGHQLGSLRGGCVRNVEKPKAAVLSG